MCLLDYNKKAKKYKHITYSERTMIETWYNSDKKSKKEIAELLHKSERTIRREINRGLITIRNYDWTEGIEKSCLRKKNRTKVYYAHPYCSGERGTNENNNRLIRRWIPKGTDITNIKVSFIKQIEDWINNCPRLIFGYKSSNMLLLEI